MNRNLRSATIVVLRSDRDFVTDRCVLKYLLIRYISTRLHAQVGSHCGSPTKVGKH
jgi:hypothetical protein